MGTFVLGVLAGWLAEWLFFTFLGNKDSSSNSSDCSQLRAELTAKNDEISKLKAAANTASQNVAAMSSATVATTAATTAKKKAPAKAKVAPINKAAKAKTTTAKKATPKKSPAKKATVKKASVKKTSAKKAPTKKASPAKKAVSRATTTTKKTGDDLTKLSGIGPSMAATLGELGITSYKKLAAMDDDILRDMLEASGARLNNNKEAMDSWNEQATLADKGDFVGLKKLQDDLKG